MFESLTQTTPRSGLAQPVLALALHAGIIALAVRGSSPIPEGERPPMNLTPVIYVPAPGGSPGHVGGPSGSESRVPRVNPAVTGPGLPASLPLAIVPGPGLLDPRMLLGPLGMVDPVSTDGLGGDTTVFSDRDLSDSPILVHFPRPIYPPALQLAGIEGAVTITYVVNQAGHVEPGSVTIVSSDRPEMSESVRLSILRAEFKPGRLRGHPVRALVRQTIRFATSLEH